MTPRFFPQHFRRTRPYSTLLVTKLTGAKRSGVPLKSLDGIVAETIAQDVTNQKGGVKANRDPHSMLDEYMGLLKSGAMISEGFAAQSNAQFEIEGSVVFDVDPVLVAELKDSDGGEIAIADLKPASDAFYIHLGAQEDIVFNGNVVFEGAYILPDERSWRITICGRRPGPWWDRPADVHTLRLPPGVFQSPLGDAIDEALAVDRADLMSAHQQLVTNFGTATTAIEKALAAHEASTDALKKALNLCAQVLAYIVNYDDDKEHAWQDDTPQKLREKADGADTQKERERNLSKLRSMGFWKIIKVGHQFGNLHLAAALAGTRAPHSRAGHWRRQAHGPQMSLRKLIYIQRTFVTGVKKEL
jgi:hypothetical protein